MILEHQNYSAAAIQFLKLPTESAHVAPALQHCEASRSLCPAWVLSALADEVPNARTRLHVRDGVLVVRAMPGRDKIPATWEGGERAAIGASADPVSIGRRVVTRSIQYHLEVLDFAYWTYLFLLGVRQE